MSMKEQFKAGLNFSRNYTMGLFAKFESADEWVFQVHPKANHALWCLGHIAYADNFFISLIDSEKINVPENYSKIFGKGSEPVGDASKYPVTEEVMAVFNERREVLLSIIDALSEEDFGKAIEGEVGNKFPTIGAVCSAAIWHETLHAGQASIAHRGLKKAPVMG